MAEYLDKWTPWALLIGASVLARFDESSIAWAVGSVGAIGLVLRIIAYVNTKSIENDVRRRMF